MELGRALGRRAARRRWAGVMSLPRVLTLGADNRLRYDVAHEVRQLRETHHQECRLEVETFTRSTFMATA